MRSVTIGRLLLSAATALIAVFAVAPAPAHAAPFNSSSNPILFVHGFTGSASNWSTMISRFQANGWPSSHLRAFTYSSSVSNATIADTVRQEVDRLLAATGASKVDIISHSMGGLSSRYYLRNLGGTAKVDRWVSLGGPNHGTTSASACFLIACFEMRIGSSFLDNLNSVDETPGTTVYGTWWSSCDTVINPDTSVVLSGATNTNTACLSHFDLVSNATVYGQVRDFVNP